MFETQVRDGAAESAADPAGELLAAIGNAERVVASMQAAQLCAVAELDALWSGTELADFVADEVALALRISPGAARERLHLARTPSGRLPDTLAALRRGDIDLYKARAIAEACARLDDGHRPARRGTAARRGGEGPPGGADPAEDGMADLWARMPADHAVAVYTLLDGLARPHLHVTVGADTLLGATDEPGCVATTTAPNRPAGTSPKTGPASSPGPRPPVTPTPSRQPPSPPHAPTATSDCNQRLRPPPGT